MSDENDMTIWGPKDFEVGHLTLSYVRDYIIQELGQGVFKVELSAQQLDESIRDALRIFSKRKPLVGVHAVDVRPDIKTYHLTEEVKRSYGVFHVDFVDVSTPVTALFYYNLIHPAPIRPSFMTDMDIFMRWRKTFQRVLSVAPSWEYFQDRNILMLYTVVHRAKATYFFHFPRKLSQVPMQHSDWILKYSTAKSKLKLGRIRSKFTGALPGPSRDLQMDGDTLVSEANEEIRTLEEELMSMQGDRPPLLA